jgi:formate--tetrahydrofolate ligase
MEKKLNLPKPLSARNTVREQKEGTCMKTDQEIARGIKIKPISDIAEKAGIKDLELYGRYKAKIPLHEIERLAASKKQGKLVLVSAITPTPAGEGKTTTSIGLSQGLNLIGVNSAVALREPSLGPVFGIKGGATGGGHSQVLPMEDINLHFTGDIHAVTAGHNLIAAMLDNHLHFGNASGISPRNIFWKRVMDMNDRALRNIVIGLGGRKNGMPREDGFDISAASEIMAILCLADSYKNLKERIENILLGLTEDRKPVRVKDIGGAGAVAALLKHALMPNLVQTGEGTPAIIHGGPFANIAQGANSILATRLAMSISDVAVTEAGFGFDLGAEKFFDIVSPYGGFAPSAVVLVATVRALKMHGGKKKNELHQADVDAVRRGGENLEKHLENIGKFGLPAVVAINSFESDSAEELEAIAEICRRMKTPYSFASHFANGGEGARDLAEKVQQILNTGAVANRLYDWDLPVEEKIRKVALEIYGAEAVDFTYQAKQDLHTIYEYGFDKLPVCMAKTQSSLSDNPKLLGRPKDFLVTVRGIIISAGAGFLVPLTGDILRMPGLPSIPSAQGMDISNEGEISGLF